MIESELAFNQQGEPFTYPDTVRELRVSFMPGRRGRPKLLYGDDGLPMTIDVGGSIDDLRDIVPTSGRVRLDAIDEHGKAVEGVPPAYVEVKVPPRNAAESDSPEPVTPVLSSTDFAVRELVRANIELARSNSELAKSVATQQPDLIKAAAEILRAADGAGLPRREPLGEWDDMNPDDEVDQEEPSAQPQNPMLVMLEQLAPLISKFTGVDVTAPRAATATKAAVAPKHSGEPEPTRRTTSADETTHVGATEPPTPSVAANPTAHLMAIQSQLTPEERSYIENVMKNMTLPALIQARDHFARMTVEDAVAAIRGEIEKKKQDHKKQKEQVSS